MAGAALVVEGCLFGRGRPFWSGRPLWAWAESAFMGGMASLLGGGLLGQERHLYAGSLYWQARAAFMGLFCNTNT